MKKLVIAAALVVASLAAQAEAYQVNLQSASQTGMGHVGTALKLGSESMYFNPAGVSFMQSNFDASLGGSAVMATIDYSNGDYSAQTDNPISTPMYFNAAFKINERFAAGLSVTTPYGSSLDWGDNWAGAELVQNISLQAFNVQPTVSYRLTEKLSVGAGLMINFGSVNVTRAVMPAGTLTAMGMGAEYADVIPASVSLEGTAGVQFGYNVGVMYDISDKFTVGASYRSKVDLEIEEGSTEIAYASDIVEYALSSTLAALEGSTFSASMPLPANLTVGVAYQPCDRLVISADLQRVFWSAYEDLTFVFSEYTDSVSEKNYEDTFIIRLGAQYELIDCLDIRAGVYFDQSPIPSDYYSPETPGMDKIGLSAGISFYPTDFMSIDLAFLYIYGTERESSVDYTSALYGASTFSGTYSSDSFAPSIGVSFRF